MDIVSRAARLTGLPHQTYLKAVAIRGACKNLKIARAAQASLSPLIVDQDRNCRGRWPKPGG
jgi:hypothetical protein